MYTQGLGTMVLTEAYARTKTGVLRGPSQASVDFILLLKTLTEVAGVIILGKAGHVGARVAIRCPCSGQAGGISSAAASIRGCRPIPRYGPE